jgi:predicted Zn-dependent peptidase
MKLPRPVVLYLVLASVVSLAAKDFTIRFEQYRLKNGLTVILSEDHAAPTLAVVVCYDVGSRDERPGRTGFAHFFEHLMFSGTANARDIGAELRKVGGDVGRPPGQTDQDWTIYRSIMPSNQLDLVLFLEADRMLSLTLTQDQVDGARADVKEEHRLRIDNQPYGKTDGVILDTAYTAFPYNHEVHGSMTDLDAAVLEDFRAFYKQYYAPNNATVVIVGDFKTASALTKVKRYFEDIPAQAARPRPDFAEAQQTSERRKTIEDEFAQTPQINFAYKIPPGNSADYYPIAVLMRILGNGGSSRLSQRLIQDNDIAARVVAWSLKNRGPGLAQIALIVRPGNDLATVEKAVYEEIAKLQNELVADWELEKARNSARRSQVANAETFVDRAVSLAESAVIFGDANLVNTEPQKPANVSKADLLRVARKYFPESNRTVVITLPKAK